MKQDGNTASVRTVRPDGSIEWRNKEDKLHRDDGPAREWPAVDANGNLLLYADGGTVAYDGRNRMIGVIGNYQYSYAPDNKRVWRGVWTNGVLTTDEVTFWSVSGQKLATYQLNVTQNVNPPVMYASQTGTNYYFGGKLIKNAGGYIGADRLGSIGHFYPYGQERPSASQNGAEKFTGYFRDAETGLDYADQRYHNPGTGRFLTADPYMASPTAATNPMNPGSWNRYAYVTGDPINMHDPGGLCGTEVTSTINGQSTGSGSTDYSDCYSTYFGPVADGYGGNDFASNTEAQIADALDGISQQMAALAAALSPQGLLAAAESRVKADLANPACAKDFKNVTKVLNKLNQIGFSNQGTPAFTYSEGVYTPANKSPLGEYNPFTKSINLNSQINWLTPWSSPAIVNGSLTNVDYAAGEASSLGLSSITPGQLMDITILHELEHYSNAIGNPDKASVESKLFQDCIK